MEPITQSPSGLLLRMERIRQDKGQKEICYGICTVSYLSKIERGHANPEPSLLALLFARLGIVYETDPSFLSENQARLSRYFSNVNYGLKAEADIACLKAQRERLLWSPLALDYLLFLCFDDRIPLSENAVSIKLSASMDSSASSDTPDSNKELSFLSEDSVCKFLSVLEKLTGHMSREQYAYYCLILAADEPDNQTCFSLCLQASEGLPNSLGLRSLIHGYYITDQYHRIHQLEPRLTALALSEGNVFALADYYFINGTAYSCLRQLEMMKANYEQVRCLLQNTGWWDCFSDDIYYNLGASYLEVGNYPLALDCLNRIRKSDYFLLWHKKALLYIRQGEYSLSRPYLQKIEAFLQKEEETAQTVLLSDWLMYEELTMECLPDFLTRPAYLELLERLFSALKKERHFGFLYQYRDVMLAACSKQRKYKKALDFQEMLERKLNETS